MMQNGVIGLIIVFRINLPKTSPKAKRHKAVTRKLHELLHIQTYAKIATETLFDIDFEQQSETFTARERSSWYVIYTFYPKLAII